MEYKPRLDQVAEADGGPKASAPRRRFSIFGIFLRFLVAVAIVAAAIVFAQRLISAQPDPVRRNAFERSFTVTAIDAVPDTHTTSIESFGEVVAARNLDIRASVAGAIVEVSPNLRPGGNVEQGELLARIDPFDYELALTNARNDLADARLALREANQQQENLAQSVQFVTEQYNVAVADLERARALVESGSITNQEIGARELVVSQREQSLSQAESALSLQDATIERSQAEIERAERTVEQAERTLASTEIHAPFDGVVVSSSVVEGTSVNTNEALASIYDANALEVRFALSERDYGLLAQDRIVGRPVEAEWDIDPEPVVLEGAITRIGAQIDPTLGGVELYASLQNAADQLIRPGTFVSVALDGTTYQNAYRLPETAIYENQHFYVVQDDRMQSVDAEIKTRDNEYVIVGAEVPEGARIITTRLAQAGDGVKVTIEGDEPENDGPPGDGPDGPDGGRPGGGGGPGGPGGPPGSGG